MDFVVVVDGILYYSHLQLLFNKVVEVGQRGERKKDMKGYFKKYIYIKLKYYFNMIYCKIVNGVECFIKVGN